MQLTITENDVLSFNEKKTGKEGVEKPLYFLLVIKSRLAGYELKWRSAGKESRSIHDQINHSNTLF
jgi:hypothetical protein